MPGPQGPAFFGEPQGPGSLIHPKETPMTTFNVHTKETASPELLLQRMEELLLRHFKRLAKTAERFRGDGPAFFSAGPNGP